MSPVEIGVVAAASWTVVACLGASLPGCASAIGKFRARRRRRSEFTNLITELPPVPDTDRDWLSVPPLEFDAVEPDDDADWFASWAIDTPLDVIERAYWHREFLAIPEVAADLRNVR